MKSRLETNPAGDQKPMSQESLYDVAVAGLLCLDISPEIPQKSATDISVLLSPGKLLNIGKPIFSTGGAVSNTGITMKKLGLKVLFMSQVGQDDFGEIITKLLSAHGGTEGLRVTSEESSSYSIILAFPGVDRIIFHNPGVNNIFSSECIDYGLVGKTRLFHFGYPPLMKRIYKNTGAELLKIFRRVHATKTLTSLDGSLPDPDSEAGKVDWKKVFEKTLPYVDIFTPSLDEALYFLSPGRYLEYREKGVKLTETFSFDDYRRIADAFIAMGCGLVLLKAGEKGIYLRTTSASRLKRFAALPGWTGDAWDRREIWAPAYVMKKIISATGAGDACTGGFLTAILRGYDVEKSLRIASCAGYQNLRALDATSGIGTWAEALAGIKTLPVREASWPEKEARWDNRKKIWLGSRDGR